MWRCLSGADPADCMGTLHAYITATTLCAFAVSRQGNSSSRLSGDFYIYAYTRSELRCGHWWACLIINYYDSVVAGVHSDT